LTPFETRAYRLRPAFIEGSKAMRYGASELFNNAIRGFEILGSNQPMNIMESELLDDFGVSPPPEALPAIREILRYRLSLEVGRRAGDMPVQMIVKGEGAKIGLNVATHVHPPLLRHQP
jgi:hypothetical protein